MSAFIDQQRAAGFAVELTCRSIGTSPSAYYQRATGQRSTRAVEDERLLVAIRRVYRANYEAYGSLRVWKALKREGIMVGRGRVERLMAADGLVGAKRRGRAWKTTVADPDGCERPDLVKPRLQRRRAPMRSGSPISRICAAGRALGSSASSWTSTAAAAWAGSCRATCAPTSCWTP